MAVLYVDDGGDNSDGLTWVKAFNALDHATVLAAAAGSTIYVGSDSTDTAAAGRTFAFPNGTIANPIKVISADITSGEEPTTYENQATGGGVVQCTGAASDMTFTGNVVFHGMKFDSSDMMYLANLTNNSETFVDCYIISGDNAFLGGSEAVLRCIECSFELGDFCIPNYDKEVLFQGCDFITIAAAGLFSLSTTYDSVRIVVEDSDLTDEPTIVSSMAGERNQLILRRCALANAWEKPTDFDHAQSSFLVESCISGTDTDPIIGMQYYADMYGVIQAETTLIRTGGASDGTTSYSWKMVSSANMIERHTCLRSPPIVAWLENDETTIKIYLYHDAAGGGGAGDLTDIECWVEVSSPNETANPNTTSQGAFQTTLPGVLTAATDIPNDGVSAWGGALATKQVITVTVGPAEDGPVVVRVCLGKASTTMYVDPKLDIS